MNSLALSMIVRDAAASLEACLASVRGVVREMVLADTGSVDGTTALAQRLGARVVSIPWTNNFAEARNRALSEVHSDWVLILDADELLDPELSRTIPDLLNDSFVGGYQVTIRNYVLSLEDRVWDRPAVPNDSSLAAAKSYPAYVEHQNVRLFRRDPEIYFVGRVHESVGPRLQQLGRKIADAPFFIHHFGLAASAKERERKNILYRELGRQKIREMPGDAQAQFELGLVEMDNFGNLEGACALFERACQLDPRLGVAWFFQGIVLLRLEKYSAALACLAQAEHQGHRTALVAEVRGDAFYNSGRFVDAARAYKAALQREPSNPLCTSKLGLAILRSGQASRGVRLLREALALRPAAPELHDRLIVALVWLGNLEEAAAAAEAKLAAVVHPSASDFLRAASLCAQRQDAPRAAAMLKGGLRVYPGDLRLREAWETFSGPILAKNAATRSKSIS
jgi:glycosyltransferase involved in cell wall biosynthesis